MRYNYIDFIRGIAFILMIVQHAYHFRPSNYNMPKSVSLCGEISRTIFIILVGVSMRLFYKKKESSIIEKLSINGPYKKTYQTLLCALLVTLTSYMFLPNKNIIFFGVLHFIAAATIILKENSTNIPYVLFIFFLSFFGGNWIKKLGSSNNIIHLIFGGYTQNRFPLDLFPIFKWLPYVCVGILIGDFLEKLNFNSGSINQPIEFIGRNTLYLYILHVIPCIYWKSLEYSDLFTQ